MTAIEPHGATRIAGVRPLISPDRLRIALPLGADVLKTVAASRALVADVIRGNDDHLLVVVGPCSVHDPMAALDYAERLAALQRDLDDELCIVMRVYFEKPRTTVGWKGLINDPYLDDSFEVGEGLFAARRLLLDIVALGLPVACEFLDPVVPHYLADSVAWGAIGARTSQSQIHRQVASGLSMPIGFKNSTEGDVQGAVDAIVAATTGQTFPAIGGDGQLALFTTIGNPDCHVVLRGGASGPNFDAKSVEDAVRRLHKAGRPPHVVVDASHDNSGKDHLRQPVVAGEIAARIAAGDDNLVGIMLESFLVAGRQDLGLGHAHELVYGQSVTDACIDWATTVEVLSTLAVAVAERRAERVVSASRPVAWSQ